MTILKIIVGESLHMKYVGSPIDLTDLSKMVAIIGSRKAKPLELETAYKAGALFAKKGFIITSGLAEGIDEEAHKGCLAVGGQTIALVHTTKNERIYPRKNRELSDRILEKNGGIIHCFEEDNNEPYVKGVFSTFQKRLAERSVVNAFLCKTVVVVSDTVTEIKGGTRYATWWGQNVFNRTVYRLDSNMQLHPNPPVLEGKVWWGSELDLTEENLTNIFREMNPVLGGV